MSVVSRGAPSAQRALIELAVRSSSSATRAPLQHIVIGSRIDTSIRYTDTGGSGLDSTIPPRSPEERVMRVRALYRTALRNINDMRMNFVIIESADFIKHLIRDMFETNRDIDDPKIADVVIFKGKQELFDIQSQFKGRHHIAAYISRYMEKKAQDDAVHMRNEVLRKQVGSKSSKLRADSGPKKSDLEKFQMLTSWKQRGLVPKDVHTWEQYQRWKADDNARFAQFAIDANFFDADTLQKNSEMKSNCAVM